MIKNIPIVPVWPMLVVLLFSAQGCTTRAWFEGLKDRERSRCYELVGQDQIEACLERVESMTYDRYQKSLDK